MLRRQRWKEAVYLSGGNFGVILLYLTAAPLHVRGKIVYFLCHYMYQTAVSDEDITLKKNLIS